MDVSTLQPTPFSSIQFHACSPYHALALSIAPCSLHFAKGEAVVFTTAAAFHIGEQLHEGGNLSVTALRAVWLPTDVAGAGWAVRFSEMSLHAVCRDLEAVPRPCIYCQLDREDDAANEVMFIPDDEAQGTKHRLLLIPPGHIHCGVWKVERNGTRAFVGTGRGFAGWGWYRIVVRNRVRSYAIALFLRRFFPCLLLHPLSHHRSLCPPSLSLSLSHSLPVQCPHRAMVVEPLFKVFTEGVLANPADGAEDDDDDDEGGLIFNKEEVELGAQQVRGGRQHLSLSRLPPAQPVFLSLRQRCQNNGRDTFAIPSRSSALSILSFSLSLSLSIYIYICIDRSEIKALVLECTCVVSVGSLLYMCGIRPRS